MPVSSTLSPIEERTDILSTIDYPLKNNEKWYVISFKWWNAWCNYVDYMKKFDTDDSYSNTFNRPGEIDNYDIIDTTYNIELKQNLVEKYDYVILPKVSFYKLKSWYGCNIEIIRDVITIGSENNKNEMVEIYPYLLRYVIADCITGEIPEWKYVPGEISEDQTSFITLISRYRTLRDYLKDIEEKRSEEDRLKSPETYGKERIRVWTPSNKNENGTTSYKLMQFALYDSTINDLAQSISEPVAIERLSDDKTYPRECFEKDFRQFEVNDDVDALDSQNKWYQARVLEVNEKQVKVNFVNWSSQYDAYIDKNSENIARCSSHTNGPYMPKALRMKYNPQVTNLTTSSSITPGSRYGEMGSMMSMSSYNNNDEGEPIIKGAVGLRNLGNTCFMNSTIQCLSNSPQLTDFFLSGRYATQINRDNALGWKGKVADEWGNLLKDLWSGKYKVVAPRAFKHTIGEFEPRFSGYNQQDSAELLSFLVDGIHEDLNRIIKKPSTTTKDYDGRPDEIIAEESWALHKLRNDSVIVDMMQGQLKSKLTCPKCEKVSVVFDPFMHISVPLPVVNDKVQTVTVSFIDKPPTVYGVKVAKHGYVKDLRKSLSAQLNIAANNLIPCDVFSSKIYRQLEEDFGISDIRGNDDIWVYEVPNIELPEKSIPKLVNCEVINFLKKKNNSWFTNSTFSKEYTFENLGIPQIVRLDATRKYTCSEVRNIVLKSLSQYFTSETITEDMKIAMLDVNCRGCAKCSMMSSCTGCELTNDDTEFDYNFGRFNFGVYWNCISHYNEEIYKNRLRDLSAGTVDKKASASGQVSTCKLSECLDSFAKAEVLDENEAWYCRNCKEHVQASKKMDIWKAPDLLVVHLKRFQYTKYWREKLDTQVDFPLEGLDMSQWILSETNKEGAIYDLYAISNHMGGLGGGHYHAYVKNLINQKWYLCDDSSVHPVNNLNSMKGSEAYVLYYSRRK